MTRPLTIQFEGTWYHVMNRGACRKPIFNSVQQRQLFIDLLAEIVQIYKIEGTDGPLFRGKFKSKLVDDEAYGMHLVRYIHLNPLKAGMTDNIVNYK